MITDSEFTSNSEQDSVLLKYDSSSQALEGDWIGKPLGAGTGS